MNDLPIRPRIFLREQAVCVVIKLRVGHRHRHVGRICRLLCRRRENLHMDVAKIPISRRISRGVGHDALIRARRKSNIPIHPLNLKHLRIAQKKLNHRMRDLHRPIRLRIVIVRLELVIKLPLRVILLHPRPSPRLDERILIIVHRRKFIRLLAASRQITQLRLQSEIGDEYPHQHDQREKNWKKLSHRLNRASPRYQHPACAKSQGPERRSTPPAGPHHPPPATRRSDIAA